MTVKELAEFTGKQERTIQRWIAKTADKMSSVGDKMSSAGHGKVVDYNIDEVEKILLNSSMSKYTVSILMQNARKNTVANTRNTSLTMQDVELISTIVSKTVAETIRQLDNRMSNIETKIEERKALLPPPQIKPRDHINMLVREYATKKGIAYSQVWGDLYKQFSYRTNSNPRMSAKNRSMSILDYIDVEGQIEILESVAIDMCKGE